MHVLFFDSIRTCAKPPLWIQSVLSLSCSISLSSSQIIKQEWMLPVHYAQAKWNHNENLPLTVTHDRIIPLPRICRSLSSQTIKYDQWCFPLTISCFLFLSINLELTNRWPLICCCSRLLCPAPLEGIVSKQTLNIDMFVRMRARMYYLEEKTILQLFPMWVRWIKGWDKVHGKRCMLKMKVTLSYYASQKSLWKLSSG